MPKNINIYYTKIDRAYFSNYEWEDEDLDEYADSIRLDLKTLGLLKDQVVLAVPHLLESEVAKDIILNNPEIISLGLVVPALPSGYNNVESFLNEMLQTHEADLYSRDDSKMMQQLIDSSSPKIARWNKKESSEWFIQRLLSDLKNPGSILRTNMLDISNSKINTVVEDIEQNHITDRYKIFINAKRIFGIPHEFFVNYIDFIYFLSGAISLDAEGYLPQDDLIKYDIASPERARQKLSEIEIFYRLFLHIVRTYTLKSLPRSALEQLSFEDITQLRKDLSHSDFIKRYSALQDRAKRNTVIRDPDKLVLSLLEIEELELELKRIFSNTIAKEVKIKDHNKMLKKELEFTTSIASALTIYGTVESVIEVINNGIALLPESKIKSSAENRMHLIWEKLKYIAESHQPASERSILLDFLGKVSKRYIEYLPDAD